MLLHDSRRDARLRPHGGVVLLEEQDRSLWKREQIGLGMGLVERALRMGWPGPYQIQAAIAALLRFDQDRNPGPDSRRRGRIRQARHQRQCSGAGRDGYAGMAGWATEAEG